MPVSFRNIYVALYQRPPNVQQECCATNAVSRQAQRIDDSIVMLGGGATEHLSSEVHLHVYVADAQAVYDRAIALGAESVLPLERNAADDDLRGGFRDPVGNIWWVATQ